MEKEKESYREIELHSEEVQEIMTRPPHALVRWGITVFFVVLILLFIGGCFFRYPDIMVAELTITTEHPPIWMVARTTGKLKEIYLPDRKRVIAGDVIAVFDNPAVTSDMQALKKGFASFTLTDSCILRYSCSGHLSLGETQSVYTSFTKSLVAYRDFIQLDLYTQKATAARDELKEYYTYILHLEKQVNLNKEELRIAETTHKREKTLFSRNVTSQADYEEASISYLTRKQGMEQLMTTLSSARIQEAQLQQNIIQICMERAKEANNLLTALKSSYDELLVGISNWELTNVFVSPAIGILSYNDVWQVNQNINTGDKVFSIIATNPGNIIGKMKLPLNGAGKVKPGQRVNIRMAGYPYLEYGYLTGKVLTISLIPSEQTYTVTVQLPQDLRTTYKKQLIFNGQLAGTAEVITDEMSFTLRLLSPLRHIWEKYF